MEKTYHVYTLSDPREPDAVRYVGFTVDPEARLYAHLWDAKQFGRTWKARWLRQLLGEGIQPTMRLIAQADSIDKIAELEIAAIADHRQAGHPLTNETNGGDGSGHWDERRRLERSEINRRRWLDTKERERQSQAMKAWWTLPEGESHRAKMSQFAKSQSADPNYKGGPRTQVARDKMRAARLGKPHPRQRTAEWNEKIGASQRGKKRHPWTEQDRANHMAALARRKATA